LVRIIAKIDHTKYFHNILIRWRDVACPRNRWNADLEHEYSLHTEVEIMIMTVGSELVIYWRCWTEKYVYRYLSHLWYVWSQLCSLRPCR